MDEQRDDTDIEACALYSFGARADSKESGAGVHRKGKKAALVRRPVCRCQDAAGADPGGCTPRTLTNRWQQLALKHKLRLV